MHRQYRVPNIGPAMDAELSGKLTELGGQHRGVLGQKLPCHPYLGQVLVGILHRHAGLSHATEPPQGYQPRP